LVFFVLYYVGKAATVLEFYRLFTYLANRIGAVLLYSRATIIRPGMHR
jgi:hypothetical protein